MSDDHEHKKKSHGPPGGHGGGAHEEHEGAPEWLISFADNVTLMMGFFVILLAMNLKPASSGGAGPGEGGGSAQAANLDMAIAVREAFHNPVNLNSDNPDDLPLILRLHQRRGESQATQDGAEGRDHDVRSVRPSQYSGYSALVEFDDGAIAISPEGERIVRDFVKRFDGVNLLIEVRGHVSAAEGAGQPDRGMKLSYDRAMAAAQMLHEAGLSWTRIRVTACADGERLVSPAYVAELHRKNQRVELVVTDRLRQEHSRTDDRPEKPAEKESDGDE